MKILLFLCLATVVGACPPQPTPLGETISRRNDELIEKNLEYIQNDFETFDSQKFYDNFCPKQAHEAAFFLNVTHKETAFDSTAEKRIPLLRKKSLLMFEVLVHDSQHRDILCQIAILEHSGHGGRQACQRASSKRALQRIMVINLDENEYSISGGIQQQGGDGDGPPTPPPNKKTKLPDDKIVYDVTDDDDEEDKDKENIDGNSLVVPISRLSSSSSSCSTASSVVDVILLDRNHPHFSTTSTETEYYRGVSRVHFPISILGGREVPRDSLISVPLPYNPQTRLTELYGLSGNSVGYTGSCNIDSFLTHLIVLSNLDPQLSRKYFFTQNSRLENGLRNILERYWSGRQAGESINSISDDIKGMWIKTANLPYRRVRRNEPIDMYGSEYSNIFEPLQQHSILASVLVCKCPESKTFKISVRNALRNRFCKSEDITKYSSHSGQKLLKRDLCEKCSENNGAEYLHYFTADTTWFLAFECPADVYTTIDISRLPIVLRIPDAFRPGGSVDFQLGYLAYSTEHSAEVSQNAATSTFHQVSFHWIHNEWFYYDDTEGGQLRKIDNPRTILAQQKLAFQSAVYFRRRNA